MDRELERKFEEYLNNTSFEAFFEFVYNNKIISVNSISSVYSYLQKMQIGEKIVFTNSWFDEAINEAWENLLLEDIISLESESVYRGLKANYLLKGMICVVKDIIWEEKGTICVQIEPKLEDYEHWEKEDELKINKLKEESYSLNSLTNQIKNILFRHLDISNNIDRWVIAERLLEVSKITNSFDDLKYLIQEETKV